MKPRLYIFYILLFIFSCSQPSTEKTKNQKEVNDKPTAEMVTGFHNGDNCFEYYGIGGQGYMHLDIVGEDVTGTLYDNNDVWGNVYHEFTGVMRGDSMVVLVYELPEDLEMVWELRIADDGQIRIFGLPSNPGLLEINPIDCEDLPDIEKDAYSSVEEIAQEEEAEAIENSSYECFYKYYNTSGGRTTVAEYLKISFNDEIITGFGAGYAEGEGEWKMKFSGTAINDTTFFIDASYEHTLNTATKFKTTETWYINPSHSGVTIKKISTNEYRQPGSVPFHRIDCGGIEGWAVRLMKGE